MALHARRCKHVMAMNWYVLVLLLISLGITGRAAPAKTQCSLAEDDEVVLLQTSRTYHRRTDQEASRREATSIEDTERMIAQGQHESNLASDQFKPGPLRVLPSEVAIDDVQAKPLPWEDAPPAAPRQAAVSQARLQEQLQKVAKQRDEALTQAEESTEALRVVQEELRLALQQGKTGQMATEETTVWANEDATASPPQTTAASTSTAEAEAEPTPAPAPAPKTTVAPETSSLALTFNGQVSTPVGVLVWTFLLITILCCGCVFSVLSFTFLTSRYPSTQKGVFPRGVLPGKGGAEGAGAEGAEKTQRFSPEDSPETIKKPNNTIMGLNLDCC